ncbi:hypothetical protein [uncultured Corynebacterium sp.]|uniref:hypothetical protein n=1 Tax=uncultured Corynebacterium sp. TaxID=159447 RepID=UPI0026001D64|nr:hypothetical protein [uncultured Corynebacterium sp.]
MTDEFALRDAAKDLLKLYVALDAAKFSSNQPRGERTMRPAPGPRPPAPDAIISLDEELTSRLFEMVREVANHIRPTLILTKHGPRLCSFIAFNAQAISELDVAPDLLEEIHDQARQINKRVNPPEVATLIKQPEKYVDIETITRNLTQRGHQVTNRQARDVAVYNEFDMCKFTDGRNGYKLLQFIHHYEKKATP